jgi:glycosyltransferase involved in cell wall biosynthesis
VNLLKEKKADLFISLDHFCSLKTDIPQCILISDGLSLKPAYTNKVKLFLVPDALTKKGLIRRFNIDSNKVFIVYPFASDTYSPIDFVMKESVKEKYAEAKEFFLCPGIFNAEDEFKNLLKAYSHFKKRQQSSFKLMILSDLNQPFLKTIENYKYRDDVIVNSDMLNEHELIFAAAYAIILPFSQKSDVAIALKAMMCNVPVITIRDSPAGEVAKDAGLYAENEIKDIGEKMMQLYKDENLRYSLIQKGTELVKDFSKKALADQLRVSIMKAMN